MKFILGIILGIVIVLGIAGAVVLFGLVPVSRTPTVTAFQGSVVSPSALQPLAQQSSDTSDMVITLSERFMNQQMVKGAGSGGQVENPQLDLHDNGAANFTGNVQVNALIKVPINAALQFSVQNGSVVIDIGNVSVGGFGVPSSLIQPQIEQVKSAAETQLNQQFGNLTATTGLHLESLTTNESSLTLYFSE